MKWNIIIFMLILLSGQVSCSYVSDAIEGAINKRAGFSIQGRYEASQVILSWSENESDSAFAGFEIYRTTSPDNEYASYALVASRWRDENNNGTIGTWQNLNSGTCSSFSYTPAGLSGKYYFRIGIIYWDEDNITDRTAENGYYPAYSITDPDAWDTEGNYNSNTDIDSISGYVEVTIP